MVHQFKIFIIFGSLRLCKAEQCVILFWILVSSFFCFVNTNVVCVHFVIVSITAELPHNVPVTAVLPYIQYSLPWYFHKSCPHPPYYRSNFTKFCPVTAVFLRITTVISPLQLSSLEWVTLFVNQYSVTPIWVLYFVVVELSGVITAVTILQQDIMFIGLMLMRNNPPSPL